MRSLTFFLFVFAIFATLTVAQTDDVAGGWKGTWTKGGDALPVTVTFARVGNAYSGAFDSDALQVAGIPIGDISDMGGRIHFDIKGDQTTTIFDGEISGDTISGTYIDGTSQAASSSCDLRCMPPQSKRAK